MQIESLLREDFRKLHGKRFTFANLWNEVQEILLRRFRRLPSDWYPRELWIYARKQGWFSECKNGDLVVRVPR